jgi:hypothetical protein
MTQDYDRAIEMAALAALTEDDFTPWAKEAMRLRDGSATPDLVAAATVKEVIADISERIAVILSADLIPAIRAEMDDATADAVETRLGETLRESLAEIAATWPTRN